MSLEDAHTFLLKMHKTEELGRDRDCVRWRALGEPFGSALVLAPIEAEPSAPLVARFRHEYALRDKLEAEWAVRPLALAEHDGTVQMVLEDPGGRLLDGLLKEQGGLELEQFLPLALRIAQSLAKLHDREILHKDLKPTNILIPPGDAAIRFTGFGYASRLPRHHMPPEPIEAIEGTLIYMAPEQTGRMNRSVDCKSDLYSLGIVFFEMLAGRPPFVSDDPVELVHFHVARRPPPLSQLRADLPEAVSDIVMKLLAKPAEDRYQTASGLAADLRTCLEAWRQDRVVPKFRLATNDLPDHLVVPEKLYGRDEELRILLAAAEQATTKGGLEVLLVAGYSGIGKSALVGELHKALIEPRALFASGKFDQYKRHIPYATWAQAFQGSIRQLLGQAEHQLDEWRRAILDALGHNGRLITELIPELALLIGEQPPVTELPPNEAQNRFFATFRKFLSTWATAEHPLVLFLDDLQWIDPGSVKLFEYLATHGELRNLLLICAYRDNEVGPAHPLSLTIESIRTRVHLAEIRLQPLSLGALGQMVTETLACPPAKAQPLIDIIGRKTGGNPFFAIQFMQGLFDDRLLHRGPNGWDWDIDQIAAKNFTDNVVDLMVGKLLRLPQNTQNALRTLACLGNTASVRKLQFVYDAPAAALDADLEETLRASYLIRRGDSIRFSHDRIHEAAYSLLPVEDRPAEHLRIGRRLVACLDPAEVEDEIFELVSHFNIAVELVADPRERRQILLRNVLAGERAKASAAYATARAFFAQAMDLLPPTAWDDDYEETLRLTLERTSCELLLGNFQQVDELFPIIVDQARSNADRARAYRQLILRNQVSGRYGEAVEVALTALRMFDLACPASPAEIEAVVAEARRDVVANLRGREIGALIDAPAMTDPDALALLGILADAMPCAFLARPDLYSWLVLNALNVTLRLGNTGDSCSVYMGYAIVLVSEYDEIDESIQYADVALKLQEILSRPDLKGRILVRNGVFINSRRNSMSSSIDLLREGFVECQAAGDYSYAVYGALEISWLTFESGAPLDEIAASAMTYAAFAEQSRNKGLQHTLRAQEAFVSCLAGETGIDEFVERGAEAQAALTSAKFGTGLAYFHLMGQMAALLHGDYRQALERSRQTAASLKSITGWVAETTYHLLAVLTLAGLDDVPAEDRDATLAAHVDLLAKRAANCPRNYACRHSLALAEVARIGDDPLQAERHYEDAIHSAHENGFHHVEAMAYELASRFYGDRGRGLIAETYLRKARDRYAQWGALGKVKQIDAQHPHLIERSSRPAGSGETHGQFQNLDVLSVVKASQAVSGEIALDRLVETLLRIAVENAGAQRGALVVDLGGTPTVVAEARMGDGAILVESLRRNPSESALPAKILNYVHRAWRRVLLDDATLESDFGSDPYLKENRIRSVLCLPMVKQSRLIGLLYLENSHVSHAFTADRVAVLDLLASQAAISLENSLLYEDLERHRDDLERTVALRTAELIEKTEQLDKILTEQEIILENASLGIVVVQPSASGRTRTITRANRAAERLFGYGPGELEGVETREIWRNDEAFKTIGEAYKLLAIGQTYTGEHIIRRWNGESGFGKLVGAAIDPADLSKGTIWLVEDITDRRAAEAALKAAKDLAEEMADAFRYKSEQVANLLDNSGQGFLSFGADLVVNPEFSRACLSMLGEPPAGKDVTTLLFPMDAPKAELMRIGVPMVLAEKVAVKKALFISLLPAEIILGDRILKTQYSALDLKQIMLVLTDITEERRLEEKVRNDHQLLQMVVAALTDSRVYCDSVAAFRDFAGVELPAIMRSHQPAPQMLEEVYREIHTFKGTLNQFSFQHAPKALHILEERLGAMRTRIDSHTVADITACIASVPLLAPFDKDLEQLRDIVGSEFLEMGERVSISGAQAVQLEKLASSLLRGETIDTAAAEIRRLLVEIGYLRKTPLRDILASHGRSVMRIAARLDKEVAPIEIVGGEDVWIDPSVFAPFTRSLIHVFRNAVAHGIEDPDTRLRAGKDECGRIVCAVRKLGTNLELTITDDGCGIDLEAVRSKAVDLGLVPPHTAERLTEEEVLDLMFFDNVTTTVQADQLSGRGVGLSAVRAEAQKLGGMISVETEQGRGSRFTISLPLEQRQNQPSLWERSQP